MADPARAAVPMDDEVATRPAVPEVWTPAQAKDIAGGGLALIQKTMIRHRLEEAAIHDERVAEDIEPRRRGVEVVLDDLRQVEAAVEVVVDLHRSTRSYPAGATSGRRRTAGHLITRSTANWAHCEGRNGAKA